MPDFIAAQGYGFLVADATVAAGTPLMLTDLHDLKRHPLLRPAVGKLEWARKHLAALEHNITETFADPAHHVVIRADLDPESGYHVFRVSEMPEVEGFEESFTHSVADVAKNLHPALDQLAWQLACDFAPSGEPPDPKGVKFPIVDKSEDWPKQGRAAKQISPDHWEFIESFQPYHGVNGRADSWAGDYVHPLRFLRELSNDDKHRLSQPAFVLPGQIGLGYFAFATRPRGQDGDVTFVSWSAEGLQPTLTDELTYDWYVRGIGQPIELGLEVLRARLVGPVEPEIDPAGEATPKVVLQGGRPAVESLQRVQRFVHLVLSEFGRRFPVL